MCWLVGWLVGSVSEVRERGHRRPTKSNWQADAPLGDAVRLVDGEADDAHLSLVRDVRGGSVNERARGGRESIHHHTIPATHSHRNTRTVSLMRRSRSWFPSSFSGLMYTRA